MSIDVKPTHTTLRWSDFTVTSNRPVDPADNTAQDSVTAFEYALENKGPRKVGNEFAFPDPWKFTVSPRAVVWSGAAQTAALLDHEQFHYDVGIVCARAMARSLSRVRVRKESELMGVLLSHERLHLHRRAGLLQRHYDRETNHSRNAVAQSRWKRNMAACLANPSLLMLGGWWL